MAAYAKALAGGFSYEFVLSACRVCWVVQPSVASIHLPGVAACVEPGDSRGEMAALG